MIAPNLEKNGISTVIMNYCEQMNKSEFDISVIAGSNVDNEYRNILINKGIKVTELPHRKNETIKFYFGLFRYLMKKHFDIIHVHGNQSAMAVDLLIAFLCGIKIRIAHSHNTTCENMKVHKTLQPLFSLLCTNNIACGYDAGKWLFNNEEFTVIPNGIDVNKFIYEDNNREEIRKELGIQNKFVIGHIGRFNDQKNHEYLLRIFECFSKINDDAVLLLIGTGPLFNVISQAISNSKINNKIILYGETTTPERMYAAMDVFVFPSKFEGLPVTLLEAQFNGLYCIVSDRITREVDLFDKLVYKHIDDKPESWVQAIQNYKPIDRKQFYLDNINKIHSYDIQNTVKKLEKYYKRCVYGNGK